MKAIVSSKYGPPDVLELEVEAVGKHVTQFQPGDEVFGDLSRSGWGGFAECVSGRQSKTCY